MKIKRNIFFSIIINILTILFFIGCKSNSLFIPGQNTLIVKNMHTEYLKLGDSYYSLGKYQDAINAYKIAGESKELKSITKYKTAQCHVHLNEWGKAQNLFEDLLNSDPENSSLKASLAYVYAKCGELSSALKIYDELILVQPNDEKIIENYLAIILSDQVLFLDNKQNFEEKFATLSKNYPENKNLNMLKSKYDELIGKLGEKQSAD